MAAALSAWQGVTAVSSSARGADQGWRARFLAVFFLLLLTVPTRAQPHGRPGPHDLELELHARRALQKDKTLAAYNLFVHVEQGVATVSGPVPSKELASRAVEALKKVRDIHEVRDRTRIETFAEEESLRSLLAGLGGALPFDAQLLLSAEQPEEDGSGLPSRAHGERAPRETFTARPETPGPLVSLGLPAVLAVPTPSTATPLFSSRSGAAGRTVSFPARADADLLREVERLLREDSSYWDLRLEVRQGVVMLSGRIPQVEPLIRFASVLSRVPGIREVDISQVKTGR